MTYVIRSRAIPRCIGMQFLPSRCLSNEMPYSSPPIIVPVTVVHLIFSRVHAHSQANETGAIFLPNCSHVVPSLIGRAFLYESPCQLPDAALAAPNLVTIPFRSCWHTSQPGHSAITPRFAQHLPANHSIFLAPPAQALKKSSNSSTASASGSQVRLSMCWKRALTWAKCLRHGWQTNSIPPLPSRK
jgi:hypothetical protein